MSPLQPTVLADSLCWVGRGYPGHQTVWNRKYFIELDITQLGNTFTFAVNLQSQSVLLGLQESSEDRNLHVQSDLGVQQSLVLLLLSPQLSQQLLQLRLLRSQLVKTQI